MRIAWFARHATPQFVPVLNAMARGESTVFAYYLYAGARGRGWGSLDLSHPHHFLMPSKVASVVRKAFRASHASDAVVVFGYDHVFSWALLIAARVCGKSVFTQSDSDVGHHLSRRWSIRVAKRILLILLFDRSRTRVWTISDSNEEFWRVMGFSNLVRVPFESPLPAPRQPRPTDTAGSEKVVLFVGRIVPEKRVEDAVHAVGILRDMGEPVRVRIVGEGSLDSQTEKLVAEADWIEVVGAVSHDALSQEYASADALILPSVVEKYGLVVREALQFGLPVVTTTAVPSSKHLCDYGWNRVPPRDSDAMATALRIALGGPRWPMLPPVDLAEFYFGELIGSSGK